MWYNITDYLYGGLTGYKDEFYIEMPVFAAIVFIVGLLIVSKAIAGSIPARLSTNRAEVLITKTEIQQTREACRADAFIWCFVLMGVISALGIIMADKATTAWAGTLIMLMDLIVFLISILVLAIKRAPKSKAVFSFFSMLLIGAGIMIFGSMDIDYAVRLKHLIFFVFVLAIFILFEYALYLLLIDRNNDPFRYARGYYDEEPPKPLYTEFGKPVDVRVIKPCKGKKLKVRRFNIYNKNNSDTETRKAAEVPEPKRYYVFYVDKNKVLCADNADSHKAQQSCYKTLYEVSKASLMLEAGSRK